MTKLELKSIIKECYFEIKADNQPINEEYTVGTDKDGNWCVFEDGKEVSRCDNHREAEEEKERFEKEDEEKRKNNT